MNKLNELGNELIQYKTELMKEYPEIIKKSLASSVETLCVNKIIDITTHQLIIDNSNSLEDFYDYVMTQEAFLKTREELLLEYEEIRKAINVSLEKNELVNYIETINNIDTEMISIVYKGFIIDKDFVKRYFKIGNSKMDKLMQKQGFIEKFAVLRLPRILEEFLNTVDYPKELFDCKATNTCLEECVEQENNTYDIRLVFDIPIKILEDKEINNEDILLNIKDIILNAKEFYDKRMI